MKYLIRVDKKNFNTKIIENIEIDAPDVLRTPIYIENPYGKILIIGDCINLSDYISELKQNVRPEIIIANLNGNFHLYFFDQINNKLFVFNSLWGIIPIYYKITKESAFFGSSLKLIRYATNSNQLNKKYLFQSIIFNYSLCDDTFYEGIAVLPVNSFIELSPNLNNKVNCYFNIEDHFTTNLKSGKNALHDLSDLFIQETAKWFPSERFAVSFTGGFDGRTLVSVAKYYDQDFLTYSFGNTGASDLELPKTQAKKLGVEFKEIKLDENYAKNYYRSNFKDVIINSEGRAGINRAHYNYAAELLKSQVRFIITGNFGSEIFRSLHLTGVLFSKAMFFVINFALDSSWIKRIESLPEYIILNKEYFKTAWEETVNDIYEIIKRSNTKEKNLLVYKFVLEEVFRKYFGAEIVIQLKYLLNRTPYLNIIFIKELLKTKYAGAYSKFFTHNPFVRFKGQELYSHIIKKTSPLLYHAYTNKGYKPKDLLTPVGKLNLLKNYFRRRFSSAPDPEMDPFGVILAYQLNKNLILSLNQKNLFFNTSIITKYLLDNKNENIGFALKLISLLYYIKSEGLDE